MWLRKSKHPRKHFQNFHQSSVLSTDKIEIHQSQPLEWPSDLLYVMLAGCDWWISIRSVDNTQDWQKFCKRFRGCSVFQSRVSTKMVVRNFLEIDFAMKTNDKKSLEIPSEVLQLRDFSLLFVITKSVLSNRKTNVWLTWKMSPEFDIPFTRWMKWVIVARS